jgi:TonB family protein
VLEQVLPTVPQSARNTITGKIKVVVRVEVSPSGEVSEAKLISAGPSQYFANLALAAARRWKFTPEQVHGEGAPSAWNLRFQFSRSATQVYPTEARGE